MSTGAVCFREIRDSDLPMIRVWRNSSDVARFMYTDHQISEAEHRAWFARVRTDDRVGYWIIELDGTPVGIANIVDIDFDRQSASWAFYLADERTRGQGLGLYVEYCVLAHVFDHLGLETLCCEVLETNPAVSALHQSVGFEETGRLRGRAIKDGKPVDAFSYAMNRSAWRSTARARLEERIRAKGRAPSPGLSIGKRVRSDGATAAH